MTVLRGKGRLEALPASRNNFISIKALRQDIAVPPRWADAFPIQEVLDGFVAATDARMVSCMKLVVGGSGECNHQAAGHRKIRARKLDYAGYRTRADNKGAGENALPDLRPSHDQRVILRRSAGQCCDGQSRRHACSSNGAAPSRIFRRPSSGDEGQTTRVAASGTRFHCHDRPLEDAQGFRAT